MRKLGQILLSKYQLSTIILNENELIDIFGILKGFVVIGLSRQFRGRFWELVVGLHTIPDLNEIINKLNQGFYNDKLNKVLKKYESNLILYQNRITLDLNQRNLPNSVKYTFTKILNKFEEDPSNCLYDLIEFYENNLRDYIKKRISAQTPKQWYRKHVESLFDQSKVGIIDSNFYKDETHSFKHIYNHINPLIYTNLEDLHLIIYAPENRQKFFKNFNELTSEFMNKIEEYRNSISHYRPIEKKEDAIFYILKMLELLHSS